MAPRTSTKSTTKCKTMPKTSDVPIIKKNGETDDITRLIALRLQMPPHVPENDDDDLDTVDKNSDEDDKQKKGNMYKKRLYF